MRRLIALIVICAGLLGAGSAALACASAAATGDCCPPGAPSGCIEMYQQLDAAPIASCVTSSAASQILSADRGHGSADPAIIAGTPGSPPDLARSSRLDPPIIRSAPTDRSLTYLHTGRLRL
jgi:hypothetical protein